MSDTMNVEEIFGKDVFTLGKMKQYLSAEVYSEVIKVTKEGGELSKSSADEVAKAMKDWAVENGATHYTHWFQPLTGITAEKHDSFVSHPDEEGKMIMNFSGKELIKGEPDASSFPSGGLRSTFEARGYTAWDITSPAFLKESSTGPILCVPTVFCSYTGESLDAKTPLLRSIEAINREALRIVRLFGNTEATRVMPSVGAEQEYFLVDRDAYLARPDLIFTGRTLFGAPAPKGQELDDHYFGTIRERVGAYMNALNIDMWKLGVSAKTQHNEVAPAQHELAPIYEDCNVAVDHNQLMMESMKRVAERQGLTCLLHEKPFAGINGSGKHNNWSICTDNGVNLLDPGSTPSENIQFLLVLACIMKAVDTHADLLRFSAACVGNDHRLGAAEAPPAIISMFLGDQLDDVVYQLVTTGVAKKSKKRTKLVTGVSTLPDLVKDATDRNRTSPFAFTGNKFEFRMVGSSDSIAKANVTLNTVVAEAFCEAADVLEKADNFDIAVHDIIKEYMTKHQRIIFNGDGYSEQWVEEAKKRGLPNLKTMIDCIPAITAANNVKMYEKFGIYTKSELESRSEILYEKYCKTINIEAHTMIDMAGKQIMPVLVAYTKELADTVNTVKKAGASAKVQAKLLKEVTVYLEQADSALDKLVKDTAKAAEIADIKKRSVFLRDTVCVDMVNLRTPVDHLEMIVDRDIWPFPSYADMLFEV